MKNFLALILIASNCALQEPGPVEYAARVTYAPKAYFISPTGNDGNNGTITSPWRTVTKGWSVLAADDTLYVRGGTYPTNSQMTLNGRSGTSGHRINIFSYQSEKPIFDYTASSDHNSKSGISASNVNWIHWKGLRITGITQFSGTYNYGMFLGGNASNNIVENCEFDHIGGSGFFVAGPNSNNNLILNCDAHHLQDGLSPAPYGGSNGFECTGQTTADNNIFRYCRAWWCSDDGYDGFATTSSLTFDGCWAFWNGYIPGTFNQAGNGCGFKAGPAQSGVINAVRRVFTNCLSFENRFNGFDQNFNGNGSFQQTLYNNTAYKNKGRGFFYAGWTAVNTLRNNLSYANLVPADVNPQSIHDHNSWDSPVTLSDADFVSVSSVGMDGPRQADGSLPVLQFMQLAAGSDLINKGVTVGLPYSGPSPDLGAFESGVVTPPPPPTTYLSAARAGSFTRNNCPSGQVGGTVAYAVPAGLYSSTVSQADADSKAQADVTANGQGYANTNAICSTTPPVTFLSASKSATYTRNDCPTGATGSQVTYVVIAGKYTSTISQADADAQAVTDVNTNGQNNANTVGTCTTTPVPPPASKCSFWDKLFRRKGCKF